LDKFDSTVEKAAKVAGRADPADPTRNLYGQEGWIILLNSLHQFKVQGLDKIPTNATDY
jgi:hypothetical protein